MKHGIEFNKGFHYKRCDADEYFTTNDRNKIYLIGKYFESGEKPYQKQIHFKTLEEKYIKISAREFSIAISRHKKNHIDLFNNM